PHVGPALLAVLSLSRSSHMKKLFCLLALAAIVALASAPATPAADPPKKKRLLLVTHSGGFIHDSVGFAEDIMKDIGPKNGLEVTCFRYTEDPDKKVKDKNGKEITALEAYSERFRGATKLTVEKENCGRINKDTLKNFDVVLFFTTGNPLTKQELVDLEDWVKA